MALAGLAQSFNPSILNQWLKAHGGYINGFQFVWSSLNQLGFVYQGRVTNSQIKNQLDQNNVVICSINGGARYVLAYGYSSDNILVNDPNGNNVLYPLSAFDDGQTGVYTVTGTSSAYKKLIQRLKSVKKLSEVDKRWWNKENTAKV